MDLFKKINTNMGGPIGQHQKWSHGYFSFPRLEGEIDPHMIFNGKKHLVWSLNNYLGLANHPEVRKADAQAAADYGMAYPMGARMMSGNTKHHEELEDSLAEFVGKQAAFLLNYGYQGMVSIIDALVDRKDVIVYDAESHACIIDGVRLHMGKRFVYQHNDIDSFEKQLQHAQRIVEKTGGGILVITEGVFGMSGAQGKLKEIIALKEKYTFRLLVDDAHGFGTMGFKGSGTHEAQNCVDGVDLYFGTFAKSMAGIGAFIAADTEIINYLRYNMRSQTFAKALPMPMVIGLKKRFELLRSNPQLRENLWTIARALQSGLVAQGFDIGVTDSMVTPVFLKGDLNEATSLTMELREKHGIFCSIVVYPVIPKGLIMLRLIPTALHTIEDVEQTLDAFNAVSTKLMEGHYKMAAA
ncbi:MULTISPECIES: pyridoxal phosphate-dependent aminotransferase family protein [unclassified Mucilaginibacter]|uniref:aminotransferase class I/II-fold pyridoxal phosphate-dependent enzyme n=1 Tax=unclassified Mucilaginibacter TaxID=2617802 RepID=UPI002AC9897C|nr:MULTISPECIES: pyridoxal phosphate-dependent aminotransferase family protein [unclassified Mucilaginibacter]MEB0249197.1 pyridoxal phosphate-dependent aminotransferase family protein [Mucilaginibacter sp. 5B2]MEB0260679.1 pyridoxal phosphate-dependent aminotransferase family protein [Mucilaginibacter sp. 10I4]MEB0277436.1 pyridoxal phosphate-dependent aminotransferase family protein [Mucilaginibacter sp. 10B2]MEB0300939.1 pyridoxal phosphate-dependent aminotransferase family protein [Mucilagi